MQSIKQHLIEEVDGTIRMKEQEIQNSIDERTLLVARLKVESRALKMHDLSEHLREDFKYSAQALESMLMQEDQRNIELKKELEVLKFRKSVIEGQFLDDDFEQ